MGWLAAGVRAAATSRAVWAAPLRRLSLASPRREGGMRFSGKHEWVTVSGAEGRVGITAYAADQLGDVVYAQLPDPDTEVSAGEEVGTVESVKAASDLCSPVSGQVVAKNEAVEDEPSLINKAPEKEGWLFTLRLSDKGELEGLMDKEAYEAYCKSQTQEEN